MARIAWGWLENQQKPGHPSAFTLLHKENSRMIRSLPGSGVFRLCIAFQISGYLGGCSSQRKHSAGENGPLAAPSFEKEGCHP